jgi:glycerol uptake facilitator-like aquaporin
MPDVQRFFVFMATAFLLFVALLRFTVRGRATKPSMATTCALGFVVVVIGMLFARYSHLALPQRSIRPRLQAG